MRRMPLLLLAITCCLPAGCAPGYPEASPVVGRVTVNGEPLGSGEVQFLSSDGLVATGRVEPDGSYRLTTFQPDDGAMPGSHQVSVKSQQSTGLGIDSLFEPVPARYADPETSGLTASVTDGMNQIDLPLTTAPPHNTQDVQTEPRSTQTSLYSDSR